MRKREQSDVPPAPTFPPDLLGELGRVDPFALDQLAEFAGPSVFNPIIGTSTGETLDNLESAMQVLACHHGGRRAAMRSPARLGAERANAMGGCTVRGFQMRTKRGQQ